MFLQAGCDRSGEQDSDTPGSEKSAAGKGGEGTQEKNKPKPPPELSPTDQLAADGQLIRMARAGNVDGVKEWLRRGANVNAVTEYGWTPLYEAAENGHKAVAELLIAKGANVNAARENGSTPLHAAAGEGYKDVAELLIARGANINAKDKDGRTPLLLAANAGHEDIVELLRKHGAKE